MSKNAPDFDESAIHYQNGLMRLFLFKMAVKVAVVGAGTTYVFWRLLS